MTAGRQRARAGVILAHLVPERIGDVQRRGRVAAVGDRRGDVARIAPGIGVAAAQDRIAGLLLLALNPLRKTSRMGDISEQVQGMTDEELYYWFSKTTSTHPGWRPQRALRLLVADET